MSKTKPTFGKEMEPCEYEAKWANKLPKEQVIAVKAISTVRGKDDVTR